MSFRDHPARFDKAFLAGLFVRPATDLQDFAFTPVGTGQVGDSYRVSLDWAASESESENENENHLSRRVRHPPALPSPRSKRPLCQG